MAETLVYEPYNHKSLVIRGDRSKYGTMIKNLGGRWNPKLLKGGVGWTFPKAREGELKKMIESIKQDKQMNEMKSHAKTRKGQLKYHRAISEEESESEDEEDEESDDEEENSENSENSEKSESEDNSSESEKSDTVQRFEKLRKKKHKSPEKIRPKKKKVLREVKKKPKQKERKEKKTLKNRKHSGRTTHRLTDRELEYYRGFSKNPKRTRYPDDSESGSDDSEFSESSSEEDSSGSSGFPSYENSPIPRRQKKKSHNPSIEDRLSILQRRVWELEMERKRR